jgi:hypothetical protein
MAGVFSFGLLDSTGQFTPRWVFSLPTKRDGARGQRPEAASEVKFVVSGTTNTSIEFVKDHNGAGYALNIYREGHITHYKKD